MTEFNPNDPLFQAALQRLDGLGYKDIEFIQVQSSVTVKAFDGSRTVTATGPTPCLAAQRAVLAAETVKFRERRRVKA